MKRRQFLRLSGLAGSLAGNLTLLEACRPSTSAVTLTVSVAASLQDAMGAIATLYESQHPGIKIVYNFGSSGSLRQQIEQGAPVDVFISAATEHMDILQKNDELLPQSRKKLLTNSIVLIIPQNTHKVKDFDSLNLAQAIALGEPNSVPAGQYAQEVLEFFGLYHQLQSTFIFAKNVRQVLSYVETANVDAGLVYKTDAQISTKVTVADIAPPESHRPIIYPGAIIKHTVSVEIAQSFLQFLTHPLAQNEFRNYGFTLAS